MFGLLRFYLAWMVVVAHISTMFGHAGGFAVFSFYMLSGYLMTHVMNEKYGYHFPGIKKYLLNRFLRIFPSYWFVAIVTLVSVATFGDFFYAMHKSLRVPVTLHEIVSNITIFGLLPGLFDHNGLPMARLVPAAWALHVELCFYLLIGLFLGQKKSLVIAWLIVSVIYHILAVIYQYPRYAPVYAASLPFSMGAFIYHYRSNLLSYLPTSNAITATCLLLYAIYILIAGTIPITTNVYPFYLNIIATAILICLLSAVNGKQYPRLQKADSFIGDLSYPIYLCHWLIAAIVAAVFELEKSLLLLLASTPIIMAFSMIIKYAIDDPIELKRRKVAASLETNEQPVLTT